MVLTDSAPEKDVLTEIEAQSRSALISNVTYTFELSLEKGKSTYDAKATITFHSSEPSKGTFLDFVGKQIHKLLVNDKELSTMEGIFRSNRLHFDGSFLSKENRVYVEYTNDYDHTGAGFHQFIDRLDSQEYLYTNFEPFDAHRLLPCFDQPNIKGRFQVQVTAPSDWEVVLNAPAQRSKAADGRLIHSAPQSQPFSSYLFAVIAGPYDIFSDTAVSRDKEIPLRLLCRKSLVKHMIEEKNELFTITKQGMKFYGDFFEYAYPFEKYDQIWVPEFNHGAMENIGAVTFTEHYIFREPPTEAQRCSRADTVLHEMAHMWFGNLVSPVWWDGLWLNESFATFMAAFAVSRSTRFGDLSWLEFNSGMKKWAEREDQQSTTHPIQGTVVDTLATFLNFDGITYGKGASVLKQLMAVVGEKGFQSGMIHYFQKHQWGNTTITDFLTP